MTAVNCYNKLLPPAYYIPWWLKTATSNLDPYRLFASRKKKLSFDRLENPIDGKYTLVFTVYYKSWRTAVEDCVESQTLILLSLGLGTCMSIMTRVLFLLNYYGDWRLMTNSWYRSIRVHCHSRFPSMVDKYT